MGPVCPAGTTSYLTGATGRQVIDLLFGLSDRRGTSLLLITHDPALAEQCDRTVRMADGRIAPEEPSLVRVASA